MLISEIERLDRLRVSLQMRIPGESGWRAAFEDDRVEALVRWHDRISPIRVGIESFSESDGTLSVVAVGLDRMMVALERVESLVPVPERESVAWVQAGYMGMGAWVMELDLESKCAMRAVRVVGATAYRSVDADGAGSVGLGQGPARVDYGDLLIERIVGAPQVSLWSALTCKLSGDGSGPHFLRISPQQLEDWWQAIGKAERRSSQTAPI